MSENLIHKSGWVVYKSSPDGLIKKLYGAKSLLRRLRLLVMTAHTTLYLWERVARSAG